MNGSSARRSSLSTTLLVVLVPLAAFFLVKHALPRLEMTEAAYGEYYWPRRFWLLAHTIGGLLATVLGAFQFNGRLRRARPGLHRLTGRIYLLSVLVAASCAFVLAFTSQISKAYEWGLLLGAGLWLITGSMAYSAIRRREVLVHQRWMIRNYTVTFFFITFFVAYDVAQLAGYTDIVTLAGPLVFACLLLPLAVVETVLRARGTPT